jgi:hypothetical protein
VQVLTYDDNGKELSDVTIQDEKELTGGKPVERLYLRSWEYNTALILQHLEKIITDNGGQICSTYKGSLAMFREITNRTLSGAIREKADFIKKLEELNRPAEHARAELERLEAIPNKPVIVRYSTYLSFILDGVYYHYSMDDNPFFDFHYHKIPVSQDNKYTGEYYMEKASKEWLYDCFFKMDCSDADRKEAANLIFNYLMSAPASKKVPGGRDAKKTRVPNTYDNGYHYEYIPVTYKERVTTLYLREDIENG